jgi:hypothetical protein
MICSIFLAVFMAKILLEDFLESHGTYFNLLYTRDMDVFFEVQ